MMKLIKRLIAFIGGLFKSNKMRRKISLYIADQLVDLDDQSFILFNYTMEDMTNPAIVRNSFSQSITLKGTPNNNKIFGGIWRSDRETTGGGTSGAYFDPTRKTTFTIYNELNEILESGYCKLDGISRKRSKIEYKVSLYGGLGAFFYALSYDEDGNKRTLADLLYTGQNAGDSELDFRINKDAIMNAWKRLNGDASQSALWDIINFAPAYNGLPTGTFDANKAIVFADDVGLPIPDGYVTENGYVLCSLPKKYTEWEVHDIRSYLQKPVIKFSKIIDAICQEYNNGGYKVILDEDFFSSNNPYYDKLWMTLPIINKLNIEIKENFGYISPNVGGHSINIPDGGDSAGVYEINIKFYPIAVLQETPSELTFLYMDSIVTTIDSEGKEKKSTYRNYIKYTLSAYDANGYLIQQQHKSISSATFSTIDGKIDIVGNFNTRGNWLGEQVSFSMTANGVSYLTLNQEIVCLTDAEEQLPMRLWYSQTGDGDGVDVGVYDSVYISTENYYKYTSSESARSGALISKKTLLSSENTPADYLLSFCKTFGLVFLQDKGIKQVSIMSRKTFYQDEVMDISQRVNLSEGVVINPYAFDSRWYDMVSPNAKGEYVSYYENIYGRKYGLQRINTGYAFNSDIKDLMKDISFRGASEVLENSKYYIDLFSSRWTPAVFQDDGGVYVLTNKLNEKEEFSIPPISPLVTRTWWNQRNNTYDIYPKLQFHESENKSFDERDTLVFFGGMQNLSGVTERLCVTDDMPIMMVLNDNTPCWILEHQLNDFPHRLTMIPIFTRYIKNGEQINKSLDFGTPMEVQIPDVTFEENSSIYSQYWGKYIKDRYDNDSKVMTCKVNLSGMQVNENLFRKFYYWDGALWALNKIINHSLTTWDDTECEFVKVQDKSNYLN